MTLVSNFLLFIFAVYISFYVPGRVILYLLKIKLFNFNKFVLSMLVGISFFLISTYIFSWLDLKKAEYVVLGIFLIVYIYLKKSNAKFAHIAVTIKTFFIIGVIFLGSVIYVSTTFFSGLKTAEGTQFIGVNSADGIVHIARIKNFIINFPPTHPGLAGVEFRGYHYFYDFLLYQFNYLFRFDVYDLYFRFFSFFISFLFGASFVYMARILKLNTFATTLLLILAYFTPGFTILSKIFFKADINLSILNSSNYIFDPSMILSSALLIVGLSLIPNISKQFSYAFIAGLIFGVLSQIKIYAGLVGIFVLCAYYIYLVITTKKIFIKFYIATVAVTAILTAFTFLPNNLGSGSFVWAPFLFYEHFIRQEAFEKLNWELKRQIFLQNNNIARISILYVQAIGLFIFYSVGIKLIILAKSFKLFHRKFWISDYNFILLTAICLGFFIPSFFIQTVSVFDIGQFFAISILLLSIPTAYIISEVFNKNKIIGGFIVFIVILFSTVEMFLVVKRYTFDMRPMKISKTELSVYQYAARRTNIYEYLISMPEGNANDLNLNWYAPSLVSAMTGRSVYLENEIIENPQNSKEINNREEKIKTLRKAIVECSEDKINNQLQKMGSQYIVTQKQNNCLKKLAQDSKESKTVSFYQL